MTVGSAMSAASNHREGAAIDVLPGVEKVALLDGAGSTEPAPQALAAKLVDAALDVETVQKRGENKTQNYRYALAEDVVAAATKALLAREILSEFELVSSEALPFTSKQGSPGLIVTVTARLIVTDAETGESFSRLAMGSAADHPGDKALAKAATGARKYAYLHLLGIPIGDDPDAETRREQIAHAQAPKLDPERVKALAALIEERRSAGMRFDDLALIMGSAGIDAPAKRSVKSVRERLTTLTAEQADALEAELAKEAS